MNNINSFYLIVSLIVFLLLIILYNTYLYKTKIGQNMQENFGNYDAELENINNTTLNAFKNGLDFASIENNFYNRYEMFDVKHVLPLFTLGCIKHSPSDDTIINFIEENFMVSTIEFYSVSMNDIYERIANDVEIQKTKMVDNLQFIDSPVYVIIYQAPYLEVFGKEFKVKSDIITNMKPSIELDQYNVLIGEKNSFTKIHIVYTKYKMNTDNTKAIFTQGGDELFINYIKNKITRDKLCFMDCNKSSGYACGCMVRSTPLNNDDTQFYKSSCLNDKSLPTNYGMVYMLNKYNKVFTNSLT